MRALPRILLVNAVLTLLLLLGIEGGVRLLHPEITETGTDRRLFVDSVYAGSPGLRPHAAGTSNGARFTVGADGFWRYTAAADTTRPGWLFLGDSVTMGIGVDPDATFAGRIAARQDTARILNPSLIGYSSRDYRALLEALTDSTAAAFRPDLRRVTVFWCLNDVYPLPDSVQVDTATAPADPGQAVRRLGGPVLTFIRRHVRTYHWLKAGLFDRPRVYFEHDRRLYAGAPFEAALADLRRMQALAARHGLAFEVVLLPYADQLRRAASAEADAFAPQAAMQERLRAAGLPVYDAAPYLRAAAARMAGGPLDLYLYGDGIHFSAAGHARVADFISTRLR